MFSKSDVLVLSMVGSSDVEPEPDESPAPAVMTALLGVASAVLFITGLLVSKSFGEFAFDIDLKPFFLPYLLIALSRYGIPTLSVSLGGAIGEGILDVFEGYEVDDPIGFLGYVLGFTAFGRYLRSVADDPRAPLSLWSAQCSVRSSKRSSRVSLSLFSRRLRTRSTRCSASLATPSPTASSSVQCHW